MSRYLLCATVILALLSGFAPASATPGHHVRGELTGANAARAAGNAGTVFHSLRTGNGKSRPNLSAASLHQTWGPETQPGTSDGEMATQSVIPGLKTSGPDDIIYAPTMKPTDNSCIEVVTAYSNSGAAIWAWDWCTPNANNPAVVLPVDINFQSMYTTTDSSTGEISYTVRIVQTDSSATNAWDAQLLNVQTNSWDDLFTSAGMNQSQNAFGWDIFEVYTTPDPTTGQGPYCADAAGQRFESSGVQIHTSAGWQPVTPTDSPMVPADPTTVNFGCGSLQFNVQSANDHWYVQN